MKKENMDAMHCNPNPAVDREGFALVTTLLMVLVLSVLAVGVVWMATSEKKISFAEQNHISSLFSSDAGSEAGINFVRLSPTPPRIISYADSTVHCQGDTNLQGAQNYDYKCVYVGKARRLGWGVDFKNYNYRIDSNGAAATQGNTTVELVVNRLYREGY